MAASLVECLSSLSELASSVSANREQIEVLIEDIRQICVQELSDDDLDYASSVIFAKDSGLIGFLQRTANLEEIQNGKASALETMSVLSQRVGRKVLPYAVDIMETALKVYSCDRFAKVKNAAIPVMIKVLELTAGSSLGEDLKIDRLIQKLFNELTKASKLSSTVKANIYNMLGVIAEVYPEVMTPYSERLAGIYTTTLRAEMTSKSKKSDLPIIAGCLEGLTAFMQNFTQSVEEGSKNAYEIFKYVRMAIDPDIAYTTYSVPKAGLKLIARHAAQMKQMLMDEYQMMFERLLTWSRHINREVLHLGTAALEAFVKEVSEELVEKAKEGQKEASVFKFLLIKFRTIMNDKDSTAKHVSLAIRGYGLLAAPCRTFLSEEDTQYMLGEMITKCEHQFFQLSEDLEDKLLSIPSYLTALSHIIKEVDTISAPHALVMERLVVLLMENFAAVNKKLQFGCYKSVLLLLLTLMDKASIFQQILSSIVYQGLIRTCSHPPMSEAAIEDIAEMGVATAAVSYRDFIPLWVGLMDGERIKDLASEDFTLADRKKLTEAIYNDLMGAILKILSKLDLEATVADGDLGAEVEEEKEVLSADPTYGVVAKKPKDFHVFINLVDFTREMLTKSHFELFSQWVFTFTHSLVVLSTRHPLVSGFYKLLSVTMTVANKVNYFKEKQEAEQVKLRYFIKLQYFCEQKPSPSFSESFMDVDESYVQEQERSQEAERAYELIKKFSKEVLVRMKQYRDDLLASCLTLILSLPKEVIQSQMASVVPAIQTTLTLGLSFLPLATTGLDALEYWFKHLPASVIEPYYKDILPYLDPYLRTDDLGAEEVGSNTAIITSTKKSSRKEKIPVRLVREEKSSDEKKVKSELSRVKRRILYFLGSLGGKVNHTLLENSDEEISKEAVAWDTQKHLRFDVPFFDMKPVIYFDQFLPHVVKLAQQASDRQTKVAACELLHSLVLFALGRGAQLPGETQKKYPMENLYKKLFPSLFVLACDVEQVSKDLFEPLVKQLIHWFTSSKMLASENPETMALLDCIFDGLIQPKDTALRDFSAKCLREFLKWSLKQISKNAAEKSPVNAKSVLKRMFSYSLHPSAFKRLGAALAFNNIYMELREEDSLVNRFTFDILVHMVESLAIAHKDEKSLGTQEQCVKALEHLERIIQKKADMLKKDPGFKIRPEPRAWTSRKLEFAVRWLTRQCGREQTECRHACMKLVFSLCTFLPGVKSSKEFFSIIHKSEGASYFLKRFEGGGHASNASGILAFPTMVKCGKSFTLSLASQWFDVALAALDCYCWVFGQDLMVPSQLFTGKGSELSRIFESVTFFVEHLASGDIATAHRLFPSSDSGVFTPWEQEEYNRIKCTVIIRIWNFVTILLGRHSQEVGKVVPESIWSEKLWTLLCDCVLRPTAVGFNMADTEVMLKLPDEMNQILMVMSRYLPALEMKRFKSTLSSCLKNNCNLQAQLPLDLQSPNLDYTALTQVLEGYKQFHGVKLLVEFLPSSKGKDILASVLLENVFEAIVERNNGTPTQVTLSPTALTLAKSMLSLSLKLKLDVDSLMKEILDKSLVQGNRKTAGACHGDLFLSTFGSTIASEVVSSNQNFFEVLMDRAEEQPRSVSNVLLSVLDHVVRDRTLRKKEGQTVCHKILDEWDKLKSWWDSRSSLDTQSLALMVATKIFLIDTQFTSGEGKRFSAILEMVLNMMVDSKTTLAFKNQILDLLPFFATLQGKNNEKVKDCLNRFIADNFPQKSSEFSPGTHKYNDYITAIEKLLAALEISGSLTLLEIVISILCRESKHCHEEIIQASITRFVQRLKLDKQVPALDVPCNIFAKVEGFPDEIRKSAIERVCLPMLRLSSRAAIIEFFSEHIHEIMEHIEAKLNKSTEAVFSHQLTTKMCCFQLLEVMYSTLSKDDVNTKTSTVNQKLCRGNAETGKEMTQRITKAAQEAKSEDCRGETMLTELRRQLHCHAYNLLISIISCVQTDMKFYKGFLFNDNPVKGQFLLDNLIDKEQVFKFDIEFEAPMERRKKFVSIRNEAKENQSEGNSLESGSGGVIPSLHLASQYLADSSLTDDLNQYDFNMASSAQGSFQEMKKSSSVVSQDGSQKPDDEYNPGFIELEMDALNQHECMTPLIAVIRHMVNSKISPEVPKGTVAKEMPPWMPYLHDKMTSPSTNINIKLFIAKLIMNTTTIFQPYAKFWLRPLCQLLFSQEVSGEGINYFAVDLIVTMVSWHTVAIPEDSAESRAMASRVVEYLVANIYHPTRQVFRNNLELLRTVLECWHDRVKIPYGLIYNLFKTVDPKSNKSAAGVQVLGVVLSAKFEPYGPSAPVDRDRYLSSLSNLMKHPLKTVYAPTAEVVGLVLLTLATMNKETEGPFHDVVMAQLSDLSHARPDNFVACSHRIHKLYPAFTEKLMSKLLFMLPNLHGEFRAECLEVILGHIEKMDNAFLEINSKGLPMYLTHRDEDTQLVSLKIVESLETKLQASELLSVLPSVTAFSSHNSAACRMIMLDILMWAYDNYREEEDADSMKIMGLTKQALLRGLCDEDLACRLACQNFWSSRTRLPEGTLERTVSMLEAMYSPDTEPHYLAYATNLLLEATSKSPDYNRKIFEHALSECTYKDLTVHSSWRQRHAVMTPLFASTFVSQSMDMDVDDSLDGEVRATQDVQQFTQTMDAGGSGRVFNWLTQSSLDTFTETSSIGGDSHLLFRLGTSQTSGSKGKTSMAAGRGEKKTMSVRAPEKVGEAGTYKDEADGAKESHSDLWRLKRRFMKDKESQSTVFMKYNIRKKKMREEAIKEQRARRENQVTLYRKYRIGDLPDIQINYQAIIAPLQALAHRDSTVASLLFSSLFKAIFASMDEVKTEREVEELKTQMSKSIESIISQSIHYFPPFMGSIFNILYEVRSSLKVQASELADSAVISNQQTLGILVLEEYLIQQDAVSHDASTSKRAKRAMEALPPDAALWIELSRLYKSVGDFDVVLGIFGNKLGTKDITRKAIDAEAQGDYKKAYKAYEEAFSCDDWPDGENPSDAEIDFWDDGRMECLNHLTQWKDLEAVSVKGFDTSDPPNLDKVWEDGYFQEHYLPYMVRSKVKLMLQGQTDQNPLVEFINNGLQNEQHRQILESRNCEELALMYLCQLKPDRAKHYTNLAFQKFLQDWCSTTTFMVSSRREILHGLQSLVEMNEFLEFMTSDGLTNVSAQLVNRLTERWQKRSPHILLDPSHVWDDVVTNRSVFLNQLSQKLQPRSEDSEDLLELVNGTKVKLNNMKLSLLLGMADSCREQNNFTVALQLLKQTHMQCRQASDYLTVDWVHVYSETHHSKAAATSGQWKDDTFNNIYTTLEQLDKVSSRDVLKECPELGIRQYSLIGRGLESIADGFLRQNSFDELGDEVKDKILKRTGSDSVAELVPNLLHQGFQALKTAAGHDIDRKSTEVSRNFMTPEKASLELAKYCDKYLRMKEAGELLANCDLDCYPETVVIGLLKAIQGDLLEARERFPRLLQLVSLYPQVVETFNKKASEIPSWMFLLWVSQMTALLDKPEAAVVEPLLARIGEEYPNALIYPFKMSYDSFRFGNSKDDKARKDNVEKLKSSIDNTLVNTFISALEQFEEPEVLLRDWTKDICKLMNSKSRDKAAIKRCYNEFYMNQLNLPQSQSGRGDTTQASYSSASLMPMGDVKRDIATSCRNEFNKVFGKEGQNLLTMTLKQFQEAANRLLNVYAQQRKKKGKTGPSKLKDYSPWMADFNPHMGRDLEIPGQYDGLKKPLPEYHVKIVGFDERVLVMSSLRKPKRIIIRGNDEKDYPYLVKSGEDLRLDQRIGALFYIMNKIMSQDAHCCQRKLGLKTYQVIPMTPKVGIIEWMSNTCPLKSFLQDSCTDDERRFLEGNNSPQRQHMQWVSKLVKVEEEGKHQKVYDLVYQKYRMAETVKEFRIKEGKIPWDLLRRGIHQMSSCPEAFHVLKKCMITSHAVICICQYVLGIGDRHLSNFMINLKTGQMVGIDFGHAFGTATQFLPVPELMPFRLTRQIINLTLPFQVKGQMESTMIHVLRALRNDSDLLLSTMDVFVQEPSLDWKEFAEKQAQVDEGYEEYAHDEAWYPKQKIEVAKRKLRGEHSCYIMRDELALGHKKREAFKYQERVLMGEDKVRNVRCNMPEKGLSVEQQVAVLIDHATDPNILGRTWTGWEPWF